MNESRALVGDFTDLGTMLVGFQGGAIVLRGHGCPGCGHGFWTEDDAQRRLDGDRHTCSCPYCGEARRPAS